jgi:hypothetical protein
MTQAFNLAQLANKVNTSGQLDAATGLVNAVPVANGGLALNAIAARSIPLANVANTYTTLTPAASQSIRINAGNTAWEAFTPGTGTVTSVATGNGLTGGTITGSGTISLDMYTGTTNTNTSFPIGSYLMCLFTSGGGTPLNSTPTVRLYFNGGQYAGYALTGTGTVLSGTWRCRGGANANCCSGYLPQQILVQRVA